MFDYRRLPHAKHDSWTLDREPLSPPETSWSQCPRAFQQQHAGPCLVFYKPPSAWIGIPADSLTVVVTSHVCDLYPSYPFNWDAHLPACAACATGESPDSNSAAAAGRVAVGGGSEGPPEIGGSWGNLGIFMLVRQ